MPETQLKTAVLGLNDTGRLLLDAAAELDYFAVTAVADSDINLAQQFAKLSDCTAYDDYRQLITQNQLDCLFVAAPIHTCAEYLRMAIKKKCNILKVPPMARDFSEAAEFARLACEENVMLSVANTGRFTQSALATRDFIVNNPSESFFFISATAGSQPVISHADLKWRSDPVLAGGGVILYDCWEIIDRIIWNFGMPQQVYCVANSTAHDMQQRLYRTEDSAIITMKFSDTLSGNLLAGKAALTKGQNQQQLLIAQGQNTLLKCDEKTFEITDPQGKRKNREKFEEKDIGKMKKVLENFGSCLLWPDKNKPLSTITDILNCMAVIEAAYVSVRTGMPEEPGRILKIA